MNRRLFFRAADGRAGGGVRKITLVEALQGNPKTLAEAKEMLAVLDEAKKNANARADLAEARAAQLARLSKWNPGQALAKSADLSALTLEQLAALEKTEKNPVNLFKIASAKTEARKRNPFVGLTTDRLEALLATETDPVNRFYLADQLGLRRRGL
jgi:hypothetical protein